MSKFTPQIPGVATSIPLSISASAAHVIADFEGAKPAAVSFTTHKANVTVVKEALSRDPLRPLKRGRY